MVRTLEHRRHTMREKPKKHLSQAGVDLARTVGSSMGLFDLVVTSTAPRALETAIAMGFAVDRREEALSLMPDAVTEEVDGALAMDRGFPGFREAIGLQGAAEEFATDLAALLQSIVEAVPEGGNALVVSHGGIVELSAIGCLPEADHAAWGGPIGYCEGVRLTWDDSRWTGAEILRVQQPEHAERPAPRGSGPGLKRRPQRRR